MNKDKKDQGKNTGKGESRYRSRSSGSCSSHSDTGGHQSEEGVKDESSLRRFRSVNTVTKRREDTKRVASDRMLSKIRLRTTMMTIHPPEVMTAMMEWSFQKLASSMPSSMT
ncbi:hypothetical protein Ancab_005157 [Ancistrocladus abbreviatus]